MKKSLPLAALLFIAMPAFCQESTANDSTAIGNRVVIGFAIIIGYFLPAIFAGYRGMKNFGGLLAVNFLLGWTVLGWIIALVWALSGETAQEANSKTIDYAKLAAAMKSAQPNTEKEIQG